LRAFPNPTHSNTEIRVNIPRPASKAGVLGNANQGEFKGQIEVFDVRGRRVRTIFDDTLNYGTSQFRWDGRDESGRDVGTGIFFLRASIENQAPITTKLTRIK
ncbi:MAG: hypothetical protein HKN21_01300, partial [Candidatus Eisenbacteria bacterium]|nr:hypothetical protein [Candidatus Eisenbacteria bacterium]